jgi:hypothetical protein
LLNSLNSFCAALELKSKYHRQLFGEQRRQLRKQVKQLKAELPEADYLGHPDVKLLAAAIVGIKEKLDYLHLK